MVAMDNVNINLISYNVKRIQNNHKRNKSFDYLRNNVYQSCLIFLQKTPPLSKTKRIRGRF